MYSEAMTLNVVSFNEKAKLKAKNIKQTSKQRETKCEFQSQTLLNKSLQQFQWQIINAGDDDAADVCNDDNANDKELVFGHGLEVK